MAVLGMKFAPTSQGAIEVRVGGVHTAQRGEGTVEISGAESQMATVVVDVAGPEGAGRMDDQMHLHGAPQVSQAPAALKGGRSIACEVDQVPRERLATAGEQSR